MSAYQAISAINGAFQGHGVVRFIFMDEAGISRTEPFVVVAGIFVHGDQQLIALEDEIERLKKKYIPEEHHLDFVFHAKDIWSGTGPIFRDREKWPLLRRLEILHDLAGVPKRMEIPIIFEMVQKSKLDFSDEIAKKGRALTPHEFILAAHAIAFCAAVLRMEEMMRQLWPREVAQLVAEDNYEVREMVKGTHEIFREPKRADGPLHPNNILPLRNIRGSVHFAEKSESKPLQLADLCAFLIRGHLSGHPHNAPLYDVIKPMMLLHPRRKNSRFTSSVSAPYGVKE